LTNALLAEKDDDGRRFAAAFLLLHHPEARPYFAAGITRQSQPGKLDPYRDNWWCPMDIEAALDSRAGFSGYGNPANLVQQSAGGVMPAIFDADASREATQEMEKLGKLGPATDFLGGVALAYAKLHPEDARIPEALSLVVKSGHYGCSDVNTWKTTRAAFRILQLRYPKSSWAKRTPTWFKSGFDIRQEMKAWQSEN
jgi:hypothetical protein